MTYVVIGIIAVSLVGLFVVGFSPVEDKDSKGHFF